jgi:hypothetical protein
MWYLAELKGESFIMGFSERAMDSGQVRLEALGYKQELNRELS